MARFLEALGAQFVPKLYPKSSKRRQLLEIPGKIALISSKLELIGINGPFRRCLDRHFGHERRQVPINNLLH